ncbi:MAG: hypothetical protein LBQ57_03215 [Spirochaetales bacterium]|jgi:hypothetical protein|nr:hypothetical protein [Spirochaetales bacterium]
MQYTPLPIRRARDYHLYAQNGKRYLDLYLGGGRALLGHKPRGLYKTLKNEMQKGLLAEVPAAHERRFEKALLRLTAAAAAGNFRLKVYASFDRALAAAARLLGRPLQEKDIREPFFTVSGDAPAACFRPCVKADYSRFEILLPVLPFPGNFAPQPLLVKEGFAPLLYAAETGDAVSPVLLAGLTQLTEELQTKAEFPDIWKEWRLRGWVRFGCYCFPGPVETENYARIVSRFLEAGVIISPDPERPTLLPRLFSPGERRLVERLFSETV